MGDLRFQPSYMRIRDAPNRIAALRALTDQEVIEALAGASAQADPLFSNFLATEAVNRLQRARRVLEHIREGVLATDRSGNVTLLNPAAERILGYTQSEVAGLGIDDVIRVRFDDAAEGVMPVNLLQEGAKAEGFRITNAQVEGRWPRHLTASLRATPIYFARDIVGIVVTIEDATLPREAQTVMDALVTLSKGLEEAVIGKDLDGRVISWNPGCEEIYGFAAREAIGKLERDLILPPGLWEDEDSILQALRQGKPTRAHRSTRRGKDGALIPMSVTVLPIRDNAGRVTGSVSLQHRLSQGHADPGGNEDAA